MRQRHDPRLLRACGERPRRRAGQQRDELARPGARHFGSILNILAVRKRGMLRRAAERENII